MFGRLPIAVAGVVDPLQFVSDKIAIVNEIMYLGSDMHMIYGPFRGFTLPVSTMSRRASAAASYCEENAKMRQV
jgi:hypothetical protein